MTGLTPEEVADYQRSIAHAESGRTVPLLLNTPRRGKPPVHWADLDATQRADAIGELGLPKFRAAQLTKHLFERLATSPDDWMDIPKSARTQLAERFGPDLAERVRDQQAEGGTEVDAVEAEEPTLDDVFLAVTGHTSAESEAEAAPAP